jgi:hypothetical protein
MHEGHVGLLEPRDQALALGSLQALQNDGVDAQAHHPDVVEVFI